MSSVIQPRAVFGTTKKNIPGVLFRAQAMHDAFVANAAMFASPTITMIAFLALITALLNAQQATKATKATGTAAQRNTKRDALWTAMEILQKYVQGLADGMSADNAIALITAAGLRVAQVPTHQKPILAATLTTTPGLVHLVANVRALTGKDYGRKHATFHWQWSADGGKTWNSVASTPHADSDIPGLALMGTYSFRVSVTLGKVAGAWCEPVSLLVY